MPDDQLGRRWSNANPQDEQEVRLSVVVLQWDQEDLTRACADSIRRHTDVPYELIIVDNGSRPPARAFAEDAADRFVGNPSNLGFAAGMNQGLQVARAGWVAFVNNDTVVPEGWASTLTGAAKTVDAPGIICPAVTSAANPRTVREVAGTTVEVLLAFERPPSAVLWLMRTTIARDLGGFSEEYQIAGGEDLDLAFKVWANGLDVVFDQRVLVQHVGHGTSDEKLEDRRGLYIANRDRFLKKWEDLNSEVPRLPQVEPLIFHRNRSAAAGAARTMRQLTDEVERQKARATEKQGRIEDLRQRLQDRDEKLERATTELTETREQVRCLTDRLAQQERQLRELQASLEARNRPGPLVGTLWRAVRWAIPTQLREGIVRRFHR